MREGSHSGRVSDSASTSKGNAEMFIGWEAAMRAELEALVEKWRQRSEGYKSAAFTADSERDDHRFRGRSEAIQDCADELSAILSREKEPPEAVTPEQVLTKAELEKLIT